MKVSIILRTPALASYFASTVEAIVAASDEAEMVFIEIDQGQLETLLPSLQTRFSRGVTFRASEDPAREEMQSWLSIQLRRLLNFAAFSQRTEQSQHYLDRYKKQLPIFFQRSPVLLAMLGFRLIKSLLGLLERHVAPSHAILQHVADMNADVILTAPHNKTPGREQEYIKAANALGIPTAIQHLSWDNLTSKGIINVSPNRFLVWNESQKNAAIAYHNVTKSEIKIVGAALFDRWFAFRGKRSDELANRAELTSRTSMPVDCDYVLYLGSGNNIAGDETWLVQELCDALAQSEDPSLVNLKVMFRPHPANFQFCHKLTDERVHVYPVEGALPTDQDSTEDFVQSLKNSVCAIGVNTSALMDSVIIDHPVIAICHEKYQLTQMGTMHFRELLDANCMTVANDIAEALTKIARIRLDEDNKALERHDFVANFIRPNGSFVHSGTAIADELRLLVDSRLKPKQKGKCS